MIASVHAQFILDLESQSRSKKKIAEEVENIISSIRDCVDFEVIEIDIPEQNMRFAPDGGLEKG